MKTQDKKNKIKIPFFSFLLFLSLFLFSIGYLTTTKWLDPDFGWHLKTGELILERGIPRMDWYTFTMPDFPWVNHEWLTDVFIFKIHSLCGFQILLLIFLVIATLTFLISAKLPYFWYCLMPLVLGYFACLPFFGMRPQLLTAFFVVILAKILNNFLENPNSRLIYLCPILFLIWVNLHGGFFAGIFILFFITTLEGLKRTAIFKKIISGKFFFGQNFQERGPRQVTVLLIVLVVSFLATLINPYGLRIYEEVFRSIGDSHLGFNIVEWLPLFFTGIYIFHILYLCIFLGLLIPQYKKIELNNLVLTAVFLIFALLHQRHFLIFVILTIPIFAEVLFWTKQAITPEKLQFLFGGVKKWIFILFLLGLTTYGLYPFLVGFDKDTSFDYPQKALPVLMDLPLSENLFNEYGWGGYLIWKVPERKVFIDGRMPSWRKDGQFVFGDYIKIKKAEESFQEILDKYEIKIALLRNDKKEDARLNNKKVETENRLSNFLKKQDWLLKALGISLAKDLKKELINSGWQVFYEDETAIILRR